MSLTKKVAKKATFFITNEAEGAPGFALEPVAHFCSLPIEASPLWRRKLRFLLVVKSFSHTLLGFSPLFINLSKKGHHKGDLFYLKTRPHCCD